MWELSTNSIHSLLCITSGLTRFTIASSVPARRHTVTGRSRLTLLTRAVRSRSNYAAILIWSNLDAGASFTPPTFTDSAIPRVLISRVTAETW